MGTRAILSGATANLISRASPVRSGELPRPLAPAIIGRRARRSPPEPSEMEVEIHRQPLRVALDWQLEAVRIKADHPQFGQGFRQAMDKAGLGRRPLILFSLDGGPLRFAFIGDTQRRFFGDAWANALIGKPQGSSGYDALTQALDRQYAEAIDGGEPVHNRVIMHGPAGAPVIYAHTLFGWDQGSLRVVVALVDY